MSSTNKRLVEPWLRGTLTDVPPLLRAVLHALELAREDTERNCGDLTDAELRARPFGIAPVAFHLKHMARSLDRLLTYAEGRALDETQMAALRSELDGVSTKDELFAELNQALSAAEPRILSFDVAAMNQTRTVGRSQLPTTLAGLVVHIADHTQRHIGQAVTTAKIVRAQRKTD